MAEENKEDPAARKTGPLSGEHDELSQATSFLPTLYSFYLHSSQNRNRST